MQSTAVWQIPTGGVQSREFRWHGDDLPTGATIMSATKAVSPATGLTVSNPVVNAAADGVDFWLTGVTPGNYTVTITATRSDGGVNIEQATVYVDVYALSAIALVTMDEARTFMGVAPGTNAENDPALAQAIEFVSASFNKAVGCTLRKTTYTAQAINGSGKSFLFLPNWPVTTFTSLTEDGAILTKDTHFWVDTEWGLLEKGTGSVWTTTRAGVVVTYAAGYDISGTVTLPANIRWAALVEAARAFDLQKLKMWGEESRAQEGLTVTINTDELLPSTLETLAQYTRPRF